MTEPVTQPLLDVKGLKTYFIQKTASSRLLMALISMSTKGETLGIVGGIGKWKERNFSCNFKAS